MDLRGEDGVVVTSAARPPEPPAHAVIGHVIAFTTWHAPVREQGCSIGQAVDLMYRLAR